ERCEGVEPDVELVELLVREHHVVEVALRRAARGERDAVALELDVRARVAAVVLPADGEAPRGAPAAGVRRLRDELGPLAGRADLVAARLVLAAAPDGQRAAVLVAVLDRVVAQQ